MSARPRKVACIVIGRGLAAAALAAQLAARGTRVALLVEEPGWEEGQRLARAAWPEGERAALALQGLALLAEWQAAGLPGLTPMDEGCWRLDYDQLLPALGEQLAAHEGCHLAYGTRVRGISVIEGAILGAIAEDARYDARQLVNAAEDARHSALARMAREPHGELALKPFTPHELPDATPYAQDQGPLHVGPTAIQGAWRLSGLAGWPLLALGAAAQLAAQLSKEG